MNERSNWTRASCDCGRLQIGEVTREVEFLSNNYTNPDTNPKTLTTLALTLADHYDAFDISCVPAFCDFVRNYSCTVNGAVVTLMNECRNSEFTTTPMTPGYTYAHRRKLRGAAGA